MKNNVRTIKNQYKNESFNKIKGEMLIDRSFH